MTFVCVGLHNPKNPINFGNVMRAASAFGVNSVFVDGGVRIARLIRNPTDTAKAHKHVSVIASGDLLDFAPYGAKRVAVDITPGSTPITHFRPPPQCMFVFGAEDETLGKSITDRCDETIYIPTAHCLNLAAVVNVVLYDFRMKVGGWPRQTKGATCTKEEAIVLP